MTGFLWTTWVFWIIGAAAGFIGAVMLIWALVGDRSRGRKRCPTCWYDMSGVVGLRCPECGRVMKSERSLGRPRRRWRWGVVGCMIMTVGLASAATPAIRSGSWVHYVPGWALVRLTPLQHTSLAAGGPMAVECFHRLRNGTLTQAQSQRLLDRCFAKSPRDFDLLVRVPPSWPEGVEVSVMRIGYLVEYQDTGRSLARYLDTNIEVHHGIEKRSGAGWDAKRTYWTPLGQSAPAGPLTLDLQLSSQGRTIWEGTHTFPCVVGGTIDDVMPGASTPELDEQFKRGMEAEMFPLASGTLAVRFKPIPPLTELTANIACGYVIEIVRDGEVVGRAEFSPQDWLRPGHDLAIYPTWIGAPPKSLGESAWELRIRGDQMLALRSGQRLTPKGTDFKRCWTGTATYRIEKLGKREEGE